MADSYNVKKITELAAKSASDDTDLYVVGNQGTATMRKISFATIAAAVRDKLTSLTFPSLNTSNKTLPGAVNELNSKSNGSLTGEHLAAPIGYAKAGNYCSVRVGALQNMPAGSCDVATLPSGYRPYSMAVEQFVYSGIENMRITINANGVINIYNYGSNITGVRNFRCYVSFPVA